MHPPVLLSRLLGLLALVVASGGAFAQYKWVAPDGSVNYGDRPPTAEVNSVKLGAAAAAPSANAALPFALRAAADKYPVSLYVALDCKPCEHARAHLTKRGVPFSEIAVRNDQDAADMVKAGFGEASFPGLLVGRQKQVGFEAGAYDTVLDSAGYPKVSMLPPGYKHDAGKAIPSKADKLTGREALADAKGVGGKTAKSGETGVDSDGTRNTSRRGNAPAKSLEPAAPASPAPAPGSPLGFRF